MIMIFVVIVECNLKFNFQVEFSVEDMAYSLPFIYYGNLNMNKINILLFGFVKHNIGVWYLSFVYTYSYQYIRVNVVTTK